jgi:hypothetical protein
MSYALKGGGAVFAAIKSTRQIFRRIRRRVMITGMIYGFSIYDGVALCDYG